MIPLILGACTVGMVIALLFLFDVTRFQRIVKKYLLYVFVLLFPLGGVFVKHFVVGGVDLEALRIIFLMAFCLFIFMVFKQAATLTVSKYCWGFIAYAVYMLLNSFVKNQLRISDLVIFLLPIPMLMLIANVSYEESDLKRFEKNVHFLVGIIALVSFYQLVINYRFYCREDYYPKHVMGGLFRNMSVFSFESPNHGTIAIGVLGLIALSFNFSKVTVRRVASVGLISFAAVATFTRYVSLMILVGMAYFVWHKYKKNRIVVITLCALFFVMVFMAFFPMLQETDIYEKRIVDKGSEQGRLAVLQEYFRYYWGKNMIFGFGDWSIAMGAIYGTGGIHTVHNGFLEILYRGGLFGLLLYLFFLRFLYKEAQFIYRTTGNPLFIAFVVAFILINIFSTLMNFWYYGYFLMVLYMHMYRDARVAGQDINLLSER